MKRKVSKFIYRIGDIVKIISGHYKGHIGKLISFNKHSRKATIELKENLKKKIFIDISNCMLFDELTNIISRVGFLIEDNTKKRYFKKTNRVINSPKNI